MERVISISKGEEKAELVLKNANIINVFTNEIIEGDVAVFQGKIVGIGEYEGEEEMDLEGKYLAPGFVDSHVHIESSMVTPGQFAKAVVPRGVTTVITDPHEIANVKGIDGIRYMLEESEDLPLDVYVMASSCVPSTPFENAGAVLEAEDLKKLKDDERVLGLGEMMNYPGVIGKDEKVLKKLELFKDKIIDGHGPLISGKELNAYVAAGVKTEHECSTKEEMLERLRLGMYIHIREGSAAKNLRELIQVVNKDNLRRCIFCTDDKHPSDLLKDGSIDHNIRLAIKEGIDPIDCIKMASLNAAEVYRLRGKGAIAPGYIADMVVIDNLDDFNIVKVFKEGKLVAENNKALFSVPSRDNASMKNTVNIKKVKIDDLKISIKGNKLNVIKLLSHSLITERAVRDVKDIVVEDGYFVKGENLLKVAVIERHNKTGNIGLGLVEDFGLENGAIASTVAHDSHNLIVIGDNDKDMILAIEELERVGGGLTIVSERRVLGTLPLSIAGLMSEEPLEEVDEKLNKMLDMAYEKLKVSRNIDPFMTLSFIALPVIPEIKLTDLGLFDVGEFKFIELNQ
ncbi:adenine deaminase [Tepidimicrobium xylanilyticum]|uniref:Adenine deaminase n=1 Tax=Tepidimicrobium xylanilyticum TaxID=1123352 RepID=A0A1H2RK64_9FIRM|nr:adenine deaminase [Tepidimicrobium xylanilyticum]GMG95413.1 adenine deaminase [Tepidimicrobium xylanilyticum]SDW19029.1 Adenine deaminase [Tepidimicrobium xylanilyticum]